MTNHYGDQPEILIPTNVAGSSLVTTKRNQSIAGEMVSYTT